MSDVKRNSGPGDKAILADKMADALAYLSRVADGAGMDAISTDLLSIRERLLREARGDTSIAAGCSKKPALNRRRFKET